MTCVTSGVPDSEWLVLELRYCEYRIHSCFYSAILLSTVTSEITTVQYGFQWLAPKEILSYTQES